MKYRLHDWNCGTDRMRGDQTAEPAIPMSDLEEAERMRRVQQREEETWPALLQWPTPKMREKV